APDPALRRRWLVLVPALFVPLAASFFYFVLFPGTAFGNGFYKGVKIFLLIWPVVATLLVLREKMIDRSREKRHLAGVLPGVGFGFLIVAILFFLLEATPLAQVLDGNRDRIAGRIRDLGVAEHF